MLDNFRNTINNLQAFDFGKELEIIVENNKEVLADLQAEQYAKGRDKNNELLLLEGQGYTPFTKDLKLKYGVGLGRVIDRVTFFQTGALYKELFATVSGGQFTLESRVPYFFELAARAGEGGSGLNEEERLKFAETYTLPGIKVALKEKTGLTIRS